MTGFCQSSQKKSGKCMKGEKNGIYRNYEGYDNRRIVADQ